MTTLVTGATGQLGRAFAEQMPNAVLWGRSELDLTDLDAIGTTLGAVAPDLIINCAAYTDVDGAEHDEALATLINGRAVGEMAAWAAEHGARFVTFSTDYVFAGDGSVPLVESDAVDPVNAYGRSKRAGELAALEHGGLVIRTSWLLSGHPPNFVATILRLARQGPVRVVDDQHGCPTVAADLAAATIEAIGAGVTGILHRVNEGATTWFDLAVAACSLAGFDPEIVAACSSADMPRQAARPSYSVLRSERAAGLRLDPLPSWRSSLPRVVAQLLA